MSRKKNEHFSGNINVGRMLERFVEHFNTNTETHDWNVYITKVVYNDPATVVFWSDGTKTVSKCHGEDVYDYRVGILTAVLKKFGMVKSGKIIEDWAPFIDEGNYVNSVITVSDVRKRNKV